jgi:hypothetical protein
MDSGGEAPEGVDLGAQGVDSGAQGVNSGAQGVDSGAARGQTPTTPLTE